MRSLSTYLPTHCRRLAAVPALLWCILPANAELATVHLTDGSASTIELVAVENGSVQWKENALPNSPVRVFPENKISHVDFPETGAWQNAEAAFQSGQIKEAILLYRQVIAKPSEHFYPVPGNFVSLAKLRILECQRTAMKPAAVAQQAEIVKRESPHLPPDMRKPDPVIDAWAAVANKEWDAILKILESVELPGPESFFLKGVALENLGKREQAVHEYASCYVLNFGGASELTRQALQRSALLLAKISDENRQEELQAQLKVYQQLFGAGKLWQDADPALVELANGNLEALKIAVQGDFDSNAAPPAMPASSSDSKVVVKESATVATLEPAEQRDYLIPEELSERAFALNPGGKLATLEIIGGVTKDNTTGYQFDGTGGGIRLNPVAANQNLFVVKILLTPTAPDGTIADMNDGKKGGFGLYLKSGDVILAWASQSSKLKKWNLGKATIGEQVRIIVNINKVGRIAATLGEERQDFDISKGASDLSAASVFYLGDPGQPGNHAPTVSGEASPPFKGSIAFASIETGVDSATIAEQQVKHFGKRVSMHPKAPAPETPPAPAGPEK